MKKLISALKKDPVLTASGILAVISMFPVPPDRAYFSYIDWRVLALLFCLMCATNGFSRIGLFQKMAVRVLSRTSDTRRLAAVLVFLCFFGSMVITNDVSLITFVPFAILLLELAGQKDLMIPVIVLQTLAANLGSMLTPIGNPQNLYLYSLSGWDFSTFFLTMLPYSAISFLLLCLSLLLIPAKKAVLSQALGETPVLPRRELAVYTALFLLCLCCVLRLICWQIVLAVTVFTLLLFSRSLLRQADYGLLATFFFFFLFIGNMGRIPAVAGLLRDILSGHELIVAVAASQFLSNVPAAILLSGFTADYGALLVGVNIGGLGTLIASLASLISYKQYCGTGSSRKGKYMLVFTGMNVLFLVILLAAALGLSLFQSGSVSTLFFFPRT